MVNMENEIKNKIKVSDLKTLIKEKRNDYLKHVSQYLNQIGVIHKTGSMTTNKVYHARDIVYHKNLKVFRIYSYNCLVRTRSKLVLKIHKYIEIPEEYIVSEEVK